MIALLKNIRLRHVPQQTQRQADKHRRTQAVEPQQPPAVCKPGRQGFAAAGVNQLPKRFYRKKRHRQQPVLRQQRRGRVEKFGKQSRKKQNRFRVGQRHRHPGFKQRRRVGTILSTALSPICAAAWRQSRTPR